MVALCYGSGCWDRREPEDSAYVMIMGFDYDEENELYEVIVQIPNPQGSAGQPGGGGGDEGSSVKVTSAKGVTPFKAVRNLTVSVSREPFFAQNKIVVFSESLARKGLGPVYDYLARERQSRLVASPIVLKGEESITQLLRTEIPLDETLVDGLERQIKLLIEERGIFPRKGLIDVFEAKKLVGIEPIMGKIELGEQTEEDMVGEEDPVRSTLQVEGSGIFKGDKLQGWFDGDQTAGWLWINGEIKRGLVVIECPVHDEHPISIEVLCSNATQIPVITENGEVEVHLEIKADGRIQQQDCPTTYQREGELIEELDRRMATVIENNMKNAIEKAKEKNTDVFGFGNLFYRKKHHEWVKLIGEEEWEDGFEDLTVKIDVDANVRRGGLIQAPIVGE